MDTPAEHYTLAELLICANSRAYDNDGEVLVTGIGVLPRLAGSLAMKTSNTDIMMTDSEAWLLSEPNPIGKRSPAFNVKKETWMGFSRIFDQVWSGKRHITAGPSQLDRYGQSNISRIGGDSSKPKIQMLGARGFPGNSMCHANSFFVPSHNKRVFVEGECDMVCSVGYNPERLAKGYRLSDIDLRLIITDLCVMDFGGPHYQVRILSLHPGISLEQVINNTGFDLCVPTTIPVTPAPTAKQLEMIRQLDPHNFRSKQLPNNPLGDRTSSGDGP